MTRVATEAASRRRAGRVRPPGTLRVRIVAVLVPLVLWSVIALIAAPIHVIPTPWAVVGAFVHDLGVYPANLASTLSNAAIGYLAGNLVAVATALLFLLARWTEQILMQIAVMTFCIPLVAITPILVVVFPGDTPKQLLAAISVYFTTLIAAVLGLRSLSPSTVDVIRSMGGGNATVLRKARLTAMLPSLFSGLQIAAPAAILGTILGEYMGASQGLGVMLVQAQSSFEVPRAWAVALVMAAITGIAYAVVGWIGRRITPWVGKDVTTAVGQGVQQASGSAAARNVGTAILGFLGSVLLACAIWWAFILVFNLNSYFAKTPLDVFLSLTSGPDAASRGAVLAQGLAITLRDAAIGYVIGTLAACALAVGITMSRWLEHLTMPVAIVMRSIPLVAMTPLLALIFGRGLVGVTVIVGLVTFFPTLVYVVAGLRNAPTVACDVVRSMGGSTVQVTRTVRLLYAVPAIFASARIAVPGAFAGATLAEWLATGEGLGNQLVSDFAASDFTALWAASVVVVGVTVIVYGIVSIVERVVLGRYGMSS